MAQKSRNAKSTLRHSATAGILFTAKCNVADDLWAPMIECFPTRPGTWRVATAHAGYARTTILWFDRRNTKVISHDAWWVCGNAKPRATVRVIIRRTTNILC